MSVNSDNLITNYRNINRTNSQSDGHLDLTGWLFSYLSPFAVTHGDRRSAFLYILLQLILISP